MQFVSGLQADLEAAVGRRVAHQSHGRCSIGLIHSGTLDDGTAGLYAIKRHGAAALVQDPEDALCDGMPVSAIEHVAVDFTGDVGALTKEVVRRTRALAAQPARESRVSRHVRVGWRVVRGAAGVDRSCRPAAGHVRRRGRSRRRRPVEPYFGPIFRLSG
jgi:hypothetical protein